MPSPWFILCRVVDHYGDAGVCWRLARQLAHEYGLDITLFIDDITTLQRLAPALDTTQDYQRIDQITVRRLTDTLPPPASHDSFWPAVIINAFGGGLPSSWLAALERDFPPVATDIISALPASPLAGEGESEHRSPPVRKENVNTSPVAPHWIVLEYLSAEPWVETMHGLASPPPSINIPRHFFFPGFTEATGGLLREKTLFDERDAFQRSPETRRAFLESLSVPALPSDALLVSLFCYDTPALPALFDAWAASPSPIICLIPETVAPETVQRWRNLHSTDTAHPAHRSLTLHTIPFLPQTDFDRLLWSCDLNFVRGEDSFVRAQWAAKPFVWQAYRQEEQTHLTKVDAFLARYLADAPRLAPLSPRGRGVGGEGENDRLCGAPSPARLSQTALTDFTRAWNDEQQTNRIASAWLSLAGQLPALSAHSRCWAQRQSAQTDLAQWLIAFCTSNVVRSPIHL
ncbi:MAG: elongation factor P maturation arginine rhamnosyltransferase EarP [Burkholderiales bacterium]|jgi:hypothetical protein|nr:elongation factor P maturation arginine rhamnosyltransferase EarP [Burkholderiales bacterium]